MLTAMRESALNEPGVAGGAKTISDRNGGSYGGGGSVGTVSLPIENRPLGGGRFQVKCCNDYQNRHLSWDVWSVFKDR